MIPFAAAVGSPRSGGSGSSSTVTMCSPSGYAWVDYQPLYTNLHSDGVNCGFVDGHVKWMRLETIWNNRVNQPYFQD